MLSPMPRAGPQKCSGLRYKPLALPCRVWHYILMEIESIRHKALRRFIETGKAKGVIEPERIMRMVAFIAAAESEGDLATAPNFGLHALTGDRAGSFAMTLSRNWRMTFTLTEEGMVADLDLEDYHGR